MNMKIVNGKKAADPEATLRLVAHLQAPEGLAERVKLRLKSSEAVAENMAPNITERGKVLAWPNERRVKIDWLRGAVAAGLLATVSAGGVVAYRWVAPAPEAHAAPTVVRPAAQSGFATAGAMRTSTTLVGPVAPLKLRQHPTAAKGASKPLPQQVQ